MSRFYKCSCGCQVLEVDDSFVNEEGEIYFSVWRMGRNKPMCLSERVRWIWKIIKDGDVWADNIILEKQECEKLASQILEAVKEDS